MEGYGQKAMLKDILCAKGSGHSSQSIDRCYSNMENPKERLFQTISDFYWSGTMYANRFDGDKTLLEAQMISENELIDDRLLEKVDQVQIVSFHYDGLQSLKNEPIIQSGALSPDHGNGQQHYGPELLFGHYLTQYIEEDIILVKVTQDGLTQSWSHLEKHLQPLNEVMSNPGQFLSIYEEQPILPEIAGVVWWDNHGGSSTEETVHYIKGLRDQLGLSELPAVVGLSARTQLGDLDGKEVQSAIVENSTKTAWIPTAYLSDFFHYDPASYLIIGTQMGQAMIELMKSSASNTEPEEDIHFNKVFGWKTSVTVYPNTTSGELTVDLKLAAEEQLKVRLLNKVGAEVPLEMNREVNQLNLLFDGPSGMYFLQIISENGSKSFKIIKE